MTNFRRLPYQQVVTRFADKVYHLSPKGVQHDLDYLNTRLNDVENAPSGSGFEVYSVVGPTVSNMVQDPSDDFTFWLPLNNAGLSDIGESAGWTLSDHLSSGENTKLTPPESGVYAFGCHLGCKFVVSGYAGESFQARAGAVIIDPGGSTTWEPVHINEFAPYRSAQITAFNSSGVAPLIGTSTEDGFGVTLDFTAAGLSGLPFNPGATDVFITGFASRLWAYKVA